MLCFVSVVMTISNNYFENGNFLYTLIACRTACRLKSLGVFIDKTLFWNKRIEKLLSKIASGTGALKRIRPFVPHSTLQFIYNSLNFEIGASAMLGQCSGIVLLQCQ